MQKTKEIQNNLDFEIGHMVARIEDLEGKIDKVKHKGNTHFCFC